MDVLDFRKALKPNLKGREKAFKEFLYEQIKEFLNIKPSEYGSVFDFENYKTGFDWEDIDLDQLIKNFRKGEGDFNKAIAFYYFFHNNSNLFLSARNIDFFAFKEQKTFGEKFPPPEFDTLPSYDFFLDLKRGTQFEASESLPYERPPYVREEDLEADDVDEAVWLNPHNHYSIPLAGRKEELELLEEFIEATDPFLIWALIGPSGAGKTRLVSQFMKDYVASSTQKEWDAGFVRSRDEKAWDKENWEISRHTLIVIDYTYNYGEVMKAIAERCRDLPEGGHKVRLLVVDHIYPEDLTKDPFWQQFFTDRLEFHRSRANPAGKRRHLFKDKPLELEPEQKDSNLLKRVIVAAANSGGKNSYTIEDDLIENAEQQLHKMSETAANPGAIKHPLFAALMGQAIRADDTNFTNWTRRDLIDNYFARHHRLPWRQDPQGINKDPELGKWVGAVVAAATLARGAKISLLEDCLPEEYRQIRPREQSAHIFSQATALVSSTDEDTLKPLEPDILGENFLLHYFEVLRVDTQVRNGFIDMLRVAQGRNKENEVSANFLEVIDRLIRNIANDDQSIKFVQKSWESLLIFLRSKNFPKETSVRRCVSIAQAGVMHRLHHMKLRYHIDSDLLEIDYSDLLEACKGGNLARYAVRAIIRIYEIYSAKEGGVQRNSGIFEELYNICEYNLESKHVFLMITCMEGASQFLEFIKDAIKEVVNVPDNQGWLPLAIAAEYGHTEIVEILISIGANIEFGILDGGITPLMTACKNGHYDVVRMLIVNNAEIDRQREDRSGTALIYACGNDNLDVINILLDSGADINLGRADVGWTPLMSACQFGNVAVVGLLLNQGAAVDQAKTDNGITALIVSCAFNYPEVAKILISRGADVSCKTTDNNLTAVYYSCIHRQLDVVRNLIECGADPNCVTSNGYSSLHAACGNDRLEVLQYLLSLPQIELNIQQMPAGLTPLMLASAKGWTENVRLLVGDARCDLNLNSLRGGVTALDYAIAEENMVVVDLLRNAGAKRAEELL